MDRDDIIRMAREARLAEPYHPMNPWGASQEALERFAALIAAYEREACAKLVEPDEEHRRDAIWGYIGGEEGVELLDIKAAAIRARSNHGS